MKLWIRAAGPGSLPSGRFLWERTLRFLLARSGGLLRNEHLIRSIAGTYFLLFGGLSHCGWLYGEPSIDGPGHEG